MANYAQQIRNQQNTRIQLQQSNNQLRNWINSLNNNKRQLESRLREVKSVKHTVQQGLTRRAEEVASKQREVSRDIEHAITMKGFTEEIINEISSSIEPLLPNDSCGGSMVQNLDWEIRRIENAIDDANRSIANANERINQNNRSINTVNNNIRTLQRAQAQEQSNG